MNESASKTYKREYFTAMITYGVTVIISALLIKHGPASAWWSIPIALAPMVPIIFALRAFLRFFHRIDELQKRIQLEAIALSFGVTCLAAFTCGLLEYAGLPTLSWNWIPVFMLVLWGIGVDVASRRYQ